MWALYADEGDLTCIFHDYWLCFQLFLKRYLNSYILSYFS